MLHEGPRFINIYLEEDLIIYVVFGITQILRLYAHMLFASKNLKKYLNLDLMLSYIMHDCNESVGPLSWSVVSKFTLPFLTISCHFST